MIVSTTDPDSAVGNQTSTFSASWTLPGGSQASGYAVVIDRSGSTAPSEVTQTAASITKTNLKAGAYFLHVRAQESGGWGATATFPFTIVGLTKPAMVATRAVTPLQTAMPAGAHDARYQFRMADDFPWTDVPVGRLSLTDGAPVSGTAPRDPRTGLSPVWDWDLAATLEHDKYPGSNDDWGGPPEAVVRAVMTDAHGKQIATPAYLVRVDNSPPPYPTFVKSSVPNGPIESNHTVVLRWKRGGGDLAGYSVSVDKNPRAQAPDKINLGRHATKYAIPGHFAGVYWFHMRTVDRLGNWSPTISAMLQYQAALILAPTDGQIQKSKTLALTMRGGAGTAVCWWWHTPADDTWKPAPAAHVTVGGSPIGHWPVRLSTGLTSLVWNGFADTPGIDDYPGEVDLRATLVPASHGSCAGGVELARPAIEYEPR